VCPNSITNLARGGEEGSAQLVSLICHEGGSDVCPNSRTTLYICSPPNEHCNKIKQQSFNSCSLISNITPCWTWPAVRMLPEAADCHKPFVTNTLPAPAGPFRALTLLQAPEGAHVDCPRWPRWPRQLTRPPVQGPWPTTPASSDLSPAKLWAAAISPVVTT
jgi:hypothetical protein